MLPMPVLDRVPSKTLVDLLRAFGETHIVGPEACVHHHLVPERRRDWFQLPRSIHTLGKAYQLLWSLEWRVIDGGGIRMNQVRPTMPG